MVILSSILKRQIVTKYSYKAVNLDNEMVIMQLPPFPTFKSRLWSYNWGQLMIKFQFTGLKQSIANLSTRVKWLKSAKPSTSQ